MTTTKSNAELAKRIAEFADALNGYSHLPVLDNVTVHDDGSIYPGFTTHADVAAQLKDMHAWAEAFDADITVVRNDGPSVYLTFNFEMSGSKVNVHESLYRDKAEVLLSELPSGENKTTLSPNRFGALVDRLVDTVAARLWRATYKRHYETSVSYYAPHENAAEYAEKKTVEELGSKPDGVS